MAFGRTTVTAARLAALLLALAPALMAASALGAAPSSTLRAAASSTLRAAASSTLRAAASSTLRAAASSTLRAAASGTLRAAASGDGHLWWAVRRAVPAVPGRSRASTEPEFLLMHHASVEPAPTERLVMQLDAAPEAMAAEGSTVVLVTRPAGERKRLVLLVRAQRNQVVGHWYSEPRTGPKILAPLDERGRIVDLALADGVLYAVRALRNEQGDEHGDEHGDAPLEFLSLATDAGSEWTPATLPPLDRGGEPATPGWTLFREGATLCALGSMAGKPTVARLEGGAWRTAPIPTADGATPIGAFSLDGRLVLVERTPAPDPTTDPTPDPAPDPAPDPTPDPTTEPSAPRAPARIALTVVRQGLRSAWARFDEPVRPWLVSDFGSSAVVFELDSSDRGTTRAIPPSGNAPEAPVTLLPPGFASGNWIHLLILGAVSLAFMMAAIMFGGDDPAKPRPDPAKPRPDPVPRASRPRGAALSRRMLAFAIDAAPAFMVCWALFGGSPQRLLDHPILSPNISASAPAALVLAGGWLLGAIGDACVGRSLGKRVLGLAILGRDGRPARLGARVLRSLLSLVAVFSPPVMLLALFHPSGDGPAEMLSGASVVAEEDCGGPGAAGDPPTGARGGG